MAPGAYFKPKRACRAGRAGREISDTQVFPSIHKHQRVRALHPDYRRPQNPHRVFYRQAIMAKAATNRGETKKKQVSKSSRAGAPAVVVSLHWKHVSRQTSSCGVKTLIKGFASA